MKLKVRKEMVAMMIKKVEKTKNGLQIQSCSYSLQEMLVQLKRLVVRFLRLDVFEEEEYRDKVMVQLSNWGPSAQEVFFISSSCLFFIRCTSRAIVANPRRWTGRDSNSDRARTLIKWANFVSRKQGARKYSALCKDWSNQKFTRTQLSIKLSLFVVQIWYRHWSNLN